VTYTPNPSFTGSDSFTYKANDGTTDSNTATVNITVTAQPVGGTVHVGNLTGVSANAGGGRWHATVTVTVQDANGALVSGATVSGNWSAGASGSTSCKTDSQGTCTVTSPNTKKNSVTFTVTNVSHPTLSYASGSNAKSTITVAKP
jgi:protocatechuate 3,4-dioxygenase beta subunit